MAPPAPSSDPRTLPPIDPATGSVNVYVECARGSLVKDKFDHAAGALRFHKRLPRGMAWPFAYGFVCGTRGDDDDPLDAVLLGAREETPGRIVHGRLLGVIEAEQTIGSDTFRNDRFLVGDERSPAPPGEEAIADIVRFFVDYNAAQGRVFEALAHHGPERALVLLKGTRQSR